MTPPWLQQVLGPPTPGRVVSVTPRNRPRQGPAFDVQGLLRQLQGQFDQFNQAGEEQYANLMNMVGGMSDQVQGLYGEAGNLLSMMGQSERRRIGDTEQKALAASEQDLVSRGLGNTTVRTNARRGISADAERARQDLAERVAGQRSGFLERQAGATMGLGQLVGDFMLSRQFQQPNMGAYTNLLQQLAAAGGGGSGSGSGRRSGVLRR